MQWPVEPGEAAFMEEAAESVQPQRHDGARCFGGRGHLWNAADNRRPGPPNALGVGKRPIKASTTARRPCRRRRPWRSVPQHGSGPPNPANECRCLNSSDHFRHLVAPPDPPFLDETLPAEPLPVRRTDPVLARRTPSPLRGGIPVQARRRSCPKWGPATAIQLECAPTGGKSLRQRPLRRRFSFFNGCGPYRWKISCPNRPLRQAFSCPAESLVAAPKNGPFRTRGKRRDAMARWTVTLKLAGLCPRFIMPV